ncbi:uncharacterized protein HD556DRAFT_1439482 [Suillus plorans]|uniref:Uncharacterized protein n=1 Tax=Suillus plorans TaxID=116603 RepID=A0A9P7DPC5_9AGAM|nr:uncharacterized protein HD556DRAFT_1439482 [Suillus plorans]KAG1799828.1 hypothetical protein HD556DRAFT_1439482 [Suillus plorans]
MSSHPSTRSDSQAGDHIQDLQNLLDHMSLADSSVSTVTWKRKTTEESITLSRNSCPQSAHNAIPDGWIVPLPTTSTAQTPSHPVSIPSHVPLAPTPDEIRPPQAGLKPEGFWVIIVGQEVDVFYCWADVAERTHFQALHAYTVKYNEHSVHAVPIPGGPFWPMNSPVSPASPPPPTSPTLSIDSDDLWSQVEDLSDTMSQYKFESM